MSSEHSYDFEVYDLLVLGPDAGRVSNDLFDHESGGRFLHRIEHETQMTVTEVVFDYRKVYEYEDNPDETVVGFFHTHPRGHESMSFTDIMTMKAWSTALDRPLLCVIDCGMIVNHQLFGSPLKIAAGWWCYKGMRFPAACKYGSPIVMVAGGIVVDYSIDNVK